MAIIRNRYRQNRGIFSTVGALICCILALQCRIGNKRLDRSLCSRCLEQKKNEQKMKTCIISNSHPTNDVRLYYKLAHSLAKLGEVHLICCSGVSNSAVNPYQETVNSESPLGKLYDLYHAAARYKPDLVICVEPWTMWVGILLKRRFKCALVFDVHEFFADAFAERFPFLLRPLARFSYLWAWRWLESRSDLTIAVNRDILRQVVPDAQLARKGLYLPNYPVKHVWDYTCDVPAGLADLCNMQFDLIYIGGLTYDRGILKLLKVISLLKPDFPNLKVLVAGTFFDPQVQRLFNSSVNNFNLNKHIYYQDWVPAEKVGLLLKRSRIGLWVFNPKNKRMSRALPLKVMEYLAAGLPVVTTKTPLMSALIEKNGLGACAAYRSVDIATAIKKLLALKEEDYQKLSRHCLEQAEQRFNWEALEPELLAAVTALRPVKN